MVQYKYLHTNVALHLNLLSNIICYPSLSSISVHQGYRACTVQMSKDSENAPMWIPSHRHDLFFPHQAGDPSVWSLRSFFSDPCDLFSLIPAILLPVFCTLLLLSPIHVFLPLLRVHFMVRMSAYTCGEYTSIEPRIASRVGRIRCVDAPITLPSPPPVERSCLPSVEQDRRYTPRSSFSLSRPICTVHLTKKWNSTLYMWKLQ